MRALFINPGGIGDQILLLPVGKILKEKYPALEINLLTEPRSTSIEELTSIYRHIIPFDFKSKNLNIFKLRKLVRRYFYKYLFCTGASYKANFVASFGNAEYKVGFKKGIFSNLFLTHTVELNTKQYASNMFAELLLPIDPKIHDLVSQKDLIPEIKISQDNANWAKEIISLRIKEKYYAKKIVIHPGTSKLSKEKNILKEWSPKSWATLIEKLLQDENNIILLIGGPDDKETIKEIHKQLPFFAKPKNFYDLSRLKMSIGNIAALISFSDLLICSDSAPMHIAVALGKKLVAFFGPTDPNKLLPKDSRFTAVYDESLECRPCLFDTRKESCNKPVCLNVPVEKILNAAHKQLGI